MKFIATLALGLLLQPTPFPEPDSLLRDISALAATGSHEPRFAALTAHATASDSY